MTMKRIMKGGLLASLLATIPAGAAGPDDAGSVYGSSPPAAMLVYALDPELLAGTVYPLAGRERPYVDPRMAELPRIGGWFGQGRTPNLETLMSVEPELVVAWDNPVFVERMGDTVDILGHELLTLPLGTVTQLPDSLRRLGRAVDREERAETLARYAEDKLAEVRAVRESIPEDERLRVYYAEGPGGLKTDCHQSFHAELVELAGGYNVHRCQQQTIFGRQGVDLEQVLTYDPDVVLAFSRKFHRRVTEGDTAWAMVRAVDEGRVYFIPRTPFSWFDRPPSFMRLIGLQWLTHTLYPERYPIDLEAEVREFYRLFLDVELSDEDLAGILAGTSAQPLPMHRRAP